MHNNRMDIHPLKDIIQLDIQEARAGVLDTSGRPSAVEYANVIAVGEGVTQVKLGDSVFVKSWGIDIVTHEDKKYYFVSQDTKALMAIVK